MGRCADLRICGGADGETEQNRFRGLIPAQVNVGGDGFAGFVTLMSFLEYEDPLHFWLNVSYAKTYFGRCCKPRRIY